MISTHLDFILKATNGKIISRYQELFDGVGTDTRQSLKNQLFVALKGEAFDAHKFLTQAVEQGAAGLLIHERVAAVEELKDRVTIIQVEDTLRGLQDLAHAYRKESNAKFVGIAGSNGKTTSKEFCACLLSAFRDVHYSKGSFNNHWGVPFTLLAQPAEAEIGIIEMGMNHKGELQRLAEIVDADVVVCTYVGVEHIEHFGTLEKIAEAEEEIYEYSPAMATRVYNLDNEFTLKMYEKGKIKFPKSKMITFSESKKADVNLKIKELSMQSLTVSGTINGVEGVAKIPVFGRHNITNLMVAASAGLAVGLESSQIWGGLPLCRTSWGRNQLVKTRSGAMILFDGYNSNPDSMKALMDNVSLIKAQGKKIGIFAEMRELGGLASQMHEEVGQAVGYAGLDVIWFYGPSATSFEKGIRASKFSKELHATSDYDESLAKIISSGLHKNDMILVKGSRGMKLERFVQMCQPLDFSVK